MTHRIFVFLLSISLLTSTNSQTCQKVQCGTISKIDVCVLPVDSITTMQSCTDTNKECQIKSEDPTEETSCENKKEKTYIKFPE